jgi:Ufm1-specific protease 2
LQANNDLPFHTTGDLSSLLPIPLKIVGSVGSNAVGLLNAKTTGSAVQYTVSNGTTVSPQVVKDSPLKQSHVLVRCALDYTLEIPATGSTACTAGDVLSAFEDFLCHNGDTTFILDGTTKELAGNQTLKSLGGSWNTPHNFQAMRRSGGGGKSTSSKSLIAPSAFIQPSVEKIQWSTVHLDVICYVPASTTAAEAGKKFVLPALTAQLQVCRTELASTTTTGLVPLRALHFSPPGFSAHHLTIVYPLACPCIEADESALQSRRAALHATLGLPSDRPLLRVANSISFADSNNNTNNNKENSNNTSASKQTRLQDVHLSAPGSGVKGGTQHLVRGTYDYYHYMQDKFDDSGWGCAYRSLQTLCSWFQRQHYTSCAPPGHREIQSTLAALGDKPAEFIGSKQWIGAIELGFVLDTLLGVSCKVITVASGDGMPSKAREIAAHFDTQGTPIMIGGGVLAYTLLGIDYNAETGDCAFLILDPHFTGADEIGKIISGQWVAWKKLGEKAAAGGELFVPGAFYNLLCPQRPNTV